MVSQDHSFDNEVDDFSVTANRRFIVPTSTLIRIRHSMDSVEVSPFSLDSTTDSPSVAAALAGNQFHLESNSFEVSMDSEIKSTGVCKEDGKEVTQPALDDLSTSCLPSKPFKVILFTYVN